MSQIFHTFQVEFKIRTVCFGMSPTFEQNLQSLHMHENLLEFYIIASRLLQCYRYAVVKPIYKGFGVFNV